MMIHRWEAGRKPDSDPKESKPGNAGTILMDATCARSDIKYPTDLNLVNNARELIENIIDLLQQQQ